MTSYPAALDRRCRKAMPRDSAVDNILALLFEGSAFIATRYRHLGNELFTTWLRLRPTLRLPGAKAARRSYDDSRRGLTKAGGNDVRITRSVRLRPTQILL